MREVDTSKPSPLTLKEAKRRFIAYLKEMTHEGKERAVQIEWLSQFLYHI